MVYKRIQIDCKVTVFISLPSKNQSKVSITCPNEILVPSRSGIDANPTSQSQRELKKLFGTRGDITMPCIPFTGVSAFPGVGTLDIFVAVELAARSYNLGNRVA